MTDRPPPNDKGSTDPSIKESEPHHVSEDCNQDFNITAGDTNPVLRKGVYVETSESETEARPETWVGVWGFSFNRNIRSWLLSTPFCELSSNLPLPVLPKGLLSAITAPRPNLHQLWSQLGMFCQKPQDSVHKGLGLELMLPTNQHHLSKFYFILHAGDISEDSYTKDSWNHGHAPKTLQHQTHTTNPNGNTAIPTRATPHCHSPPKHTEDLLLPPATEPGHKLLLAKLNIETHELLFQSKITHKSLHTKPHNYSDQSTKYTLLPPSNLTNSKIRHTS